MTGSDNIHPTVLTIALAVGIASLMMLAGVVIGLLILT